MPKQSRQLLHYLTKNDKTIVLVTLFIALLCIFVIPNPPILIPDTTISTIARAFPMEFAYLMFLIPIGTYIGIFLNEKDKKLTTTTVLDLKKQLRQMTNIHFRAYFKKVPRGTIWQIRNTDQIDWYNAQILIEIRYRGEKTTEKHNLGFVPSGKMLEVHSKLMQHTNAQWRVMIINNKGYKVDLPAVWQQHKY